MVGQEEIAFNDTVKDLPSNELHRLFMLVGWSDGTESSDMINGFNLPFKNSTLVLSAWCNERLIGVVRVISDEIVRSVLHDLIVDPEFQGKGIGKELVTRCINHFPNTEWLVQTSTNISTFYEKIGLKKYQKEVLVIPSKWES
jgi:ribosomal protein S18 acetylase RimI-like enzyme